MSTMCRIRMLPLLWLLFAAPATGQHSKVHSAVVDLSDRFIDFKDQGIWFVKVGADGQGLHVTVVVLIGFLSYVLI